MIGIVIGIVIGTVAGQVTGQVTVQVPELVGLTNSTPTVVRQLLTGNHCQTTRCSLSGMLRGTRTLAGGAAWDGRASRLWVSNGAQLAMVGVRTGGTSCRLECRPIDVPKPTAAPTLVTGLAYAAGGPWPKSPTNEGVLYLAYENQYLAWAPVRGCGIGPLRSCSLARVLGPRRFIGAIATDATRGYLFVASSRRNTSPANIVHIARLDRPCVPVCKFVVTVNQQICPGVRLGPITGMAYEATLERLFLTDGKTVISGQLKVTRRPIGYVCRFAHSGCCTGRRTESLVGLTVAPSAPRTVGNSCTGGSCATCPGMANEILGDAVLGNNRITLRLARAPSAFTVAFLGLGFGRCTNPGVGIGVCESIRIAFSPGRPLILPVAGPGVGTGCNGTAQLPLAIPVSRVLLDLRLSTQWLLLCAGGGAAVSHCLQLRISG